MNENTRLIDLTVGQLQDLIYETVNRSIAKVNTNITSNEKKLVYGIDGIAELFGCSRTKANEIKQSGMIDKAVIQIGRKIVVDAELALKLTGGRK
ncbi:MAG: DUF3853 family protein [Bacteroidetes bacterium]|uniref:DUF3853 family protein n=1 Tax=Candidatus Gallipaludibacter merdavium TaxID=2840839 RepID=A0A9D9N4P8_9BACT|nr:DUF3853 family protein [Candidatus Gallipaludibacter merdavium]